LTTKYESIIGLLQTLIAGFSGEFLLNSMKEVFALATSKSVPQCLFGELLSILSQTFDDHREIATLFDSDCAVERMLVASVNFALETQLATLTFLKKVLKRTPKQDLARKSILCLL
jgi:hypothetical protein